jgi:hypothetical protein
MKKVFSNSADVMHVFVGQDQQEGKCSNVFFYGSKLYSYGYHYLLAEFIKNKKGENAILINDEGYSVTTAKHIQQIKQASRQFDQFFTTSTDEKKVISKLIELANKLEKAKKPIIYINESNKLFASYSKWCTWNETKVDKLVQAYFDTIKSYENKDSYSKTYSDLNKNIEKFKSKKQKDEEKLKLKKFFDYETSYLYNMNEDFVRISKDKLSIETSQRVSIPIKEAATLYRIILSGKNIKGIKIGEYTCIGLNGTLKIGCHHINVKNMHKVGKQLI